MKYLWLGIKETDNGLLFFDIFPTAEAAKEYYSGEVDLEGWAEDVSGNLKQVDGWTYIIEQEPFHEDVT